MRKVFLFIFLYFSIALQIFSQGNSGSFFIKGTINEVTLGYEGQVTPTAHILIDAGYRFNYISDWYFPGSAIPFQYIYKWLGYYGWIFHLNPSFRLSNRFWIGPLLGYNHLYFNKIINDPGQFSGNSEAKYQEWSQINDEIVLQCQGQFILFNIKRPVFLFFGVGLKTCFEQRNFIVDGTRKHKKPSTEIINVTTVKPTITAGLKWNFVKPN